MVFSTDREVHSAGRGQRQPDHRRSAVVSAESRGGSGGLFNPPGTAMRTAQVACQLFFWAIVGLVVLALLNTATGR